MKLMNRLTLNEIMWCRLFGRLMPEMNTLTLSESVQVVEATLRAVRWQWHYVLLCIAELVTIVFLSGVLLIPAAMGTTPLLSRLIPAILMTIVGGLGTQVLNLYWLLRPEVQRTLREEINRLNRVVCIECGYDLRGQVEPYCPECGKWSLDAAVRLEEQQAAQRKGHELDSASE